MSVYLVSLVLHTKKSSSDSYVLISCRCPLTGNPLTSSELVPDIELREHITNWQRAQAQKDASTEDTDAGTTNGEANTPVADPEVDSLYVFD